MTVLIDTTEKEFGSRVYDPAGEHLTREPGHDRFHDTYIGMAHIAGTGPEGAICCQCQRYGDVGNNPVKRYGFRRGTLNPGQLYPGYCHKFVHGKRFQMFPGNAKACLFYEASDNPRDYVKAPPEKAEASDG